MAYIFNKSSKSSNKFQTLIGRLVAQAGYHFQASQRIFQTLIGRLVAMKMSRFAYARVRISNSYR